MKRTECRGILGTKSYGIMPEELEQAGIEFSVVSKVQNLATIHVIEMQNGQKSKAVVTIHM